MMNNLEYTSCPICGTDDVAAHGIIKYFDYHYDCPICGRFVLIDNNENYIKDKNALAQYLFYQRQLNGNLSFAVIGPAEAYDSRKREIHDSTFFVDYEAVDGFQPRDFSEKINMILLLCAKKSKTPGAIIRVSNGFLKRMCFIKGESDAKISNDVSIVQNDGVQVKYLKAYFTDNNLISISPANGCECWDLRVEPAGWSKVEDLQRHATENSKTVFVAMQFGSETNDLRAIIKAAIFKAGFEPLLMDEYQHNRQIVPEMLYQIRRSRFVIMDESDGNQGAYYEAGYAAGCGKEVIHICREEVFKSQSGPHFDVRQVNTILWTKNELDALGENLVERIKATIN